MSFDSKKEAARYSQLHLMPASVYYNEIDKWCCKLLRARIADGSLPKGFVDERDIRLVQPKDVAGYIQCHFFCGIGGFPLATRWADAEDMPLWTAGVPCQPASNAGRRAGSADERWLWPAFLRLVRECRPASLLAENVPGLTSLLPHGLDWILAELESAGYINLPFICGAWTAGAAHHRERLWIIAHSKSLKIHQLSKMGMDTDAQRFGQSRSRKHQQSVHAAKNPFGEASGFIESFRKGTLPYVCGRHDGVPTELDESKERNKALGNAIVPQVAEQIIRQMKQTIGATCQPAAN